MEPDTQQAPPRFRRGSTTTLASLIAAKCLKLRVGKVFAVTGHTEDEIRAALAEQEASGNAFELRPAPSGFVNVVCTHASRVAPRGRPESDERKRMIELKPGEAFTTSARFRQRVSNIASSLRKRHGMDFHVSPCETDEIYIERIDHNASPHRPMPVETAPAPEGKPIAARPRANTKYPFDALELGQILLIPPQLYTSFESMKVLARKRSRNGRRYVARQGDGDAALIACFPDHLPAPTGERLRGLIRTKATKKPVLVMGAANDEGDKFF